ncbi:MAG: cation transporter [Bacteroidales bacterium]|nr:cation transporter [Bacteroidales bacterium]
MEAREKGIFRVMIVGAVVNLLLLSLKFAAGAIGRSSAMIADGVNSLSDFATDIVVLIFIGISAKPSDKGHDYGHGKFETVAVTFVALAMLAVAGCILWRGGSMILSWIRGEDIVTPSTIALWGALASIIIKELIYRYTVREGKKLDSQALVARAWDYRSDALSSIATAAGIIACLLLGGRWAVIDPIISLFVGVLIVKVAFELLRGGINELAEASLPEEVENEILSIVSSFEGVSDPHKLRTRRIGHNYAIEVHLRMDGDMSLRDSHRRASEIEHAIRERFGSGTLVLVHMEPDDNIK